MEHLRFCGSLNIACGYAGEQGFCTLTRCPVVLDEFQAMRRHQGPTGPKGRPDGHGNAGGTMKKSTCRGCGAPLVWIRTAAGKAMPCDAEPVLYKAREGAAGKIVTTDERLLACVVRWLGSPAKEGT